MYLYDHDEGNYIQQMSFLKTFAILSDQFKKRWHRTVHV